MQMPEVSYFHGDDTTVSHNKSFSVSGSGFLFIIGRTDFSRYRALGRTGLTLSFLFVISKTIIQYITIFKKQNNKMCVLCRGKRYT